MPLRIDTFTIILALFLGNLLSVLLVWVYGRQRTTYLAHATFVAGKLFQAVAWLLLAGRGTLPDLVTSTIANPLIFLGFALEAHAVTSLWRPHGRKLLAKFLAAVALGSVLFILLEGQDRNLRVIMGACFAALLYFVPALSLLRPDHYTPLRRTMGVLYLLSSLGLLYRSLAAAMSEFHFALFTPAMTASVSFLPTYLLMLLGSVGFLLLCKEQDDAELQRAATRDGLTGLWNRNAFLEQTQRLLDLVHREGRASSLLMMDLDHFKKINDTFGHSMGDQVLVDFSQVVGQQLRRSDLFGRYGGEEFVVFLPHADAMTARNIAERLRVAVEGRRLATPGGRMIQYTVSIGSCTSDPEELPDLETMLRAGDHALYVAKDMGRNCVAQCGGGELPPLDEE
ncbi:diguanylate cyclase (GGDEF) domain-containing protein [Paucidesulfovibrio gracilis DSM 16080]|uniref:diguanylate cyclase n=1 Tax=Paucidesulfovibrio gracilis DSM 16080 TaxID=1121449 RepID=A0A1T4Y3D5_9BACT|nr:GGDEF domain-containing protein [Paucidesulfovibrio gracilis]SKA96312.1 diguanylate cyclase (GGDEF) domain-containing protein [Paucidesulfovibrio gracilis DSM 16080]